MTSTKPVQKNIDHLITATIVRAKAMLVAVITDVGVLAMHGNQVVHGQNIGAT